MGSGVVFHRISKGESGGIFPQSGCFSDPAPVKNRLFQIVETGNFQNRKFHTCKAAFPYKGNISTKYPRKTNRFPQCIPHLVGKLGRNEGFRRPFLQKGSAPPKTFEKNDLSKFWSTFFKRWWVKGNALVSAFLFVSFFFVPVVSKKKRRTISAILYWDQMTQEITQTLSYLLISRRISAISFSRAMSVFNCFSIAVMLE